MDDTLTAGNDVIDALGGNDTVFAGDGADWVIGGAGNDSIDGGSVNDAATLDTTADGEGIVTPGGLFGGEGEDSIKGRAGDDLISGGVGNDDLRGSSGDEGSAVPSDTPTTGMYGGDGDDFVRGNVGDDLMYGGAGADTYYYPVSNLDLGDGADTITDFKIGCDEIEVGDEELTFDDIFLSQEDSTEVIAFGEVRIRFENTNIDDISETDFSSNLRLRSDKAGEGCMG
jgi:Ca2+-binding RTX toxin-like protein